MADDAGSQHRLSPTDNSTQRSSRNFRAKSEAVRQVINEALDILCALGVPMTDSGRRRESMAMAFLAVANVKTSQGWEDAESGGSMKTRDIIDFRNAHLEEQGSAGSYDDIRRKDLRLLVTAGIVVNTLPGSAHNRPTRGYALHPAYAKAARTFGTPDWSAQLDEVLGRQPTLRSKLDTTREIERVPIKLPGGGTLKFGPGAHNRLIASVIEEFLPRFGHGAEVLYVGDAEDKDAHHNEQRLQELGFFALNHEELPDIVAFTESKSWVLVIEAVHSSGPFDALRHLRLGQLLVDVKAEGVVYVTAFPDRTTFRRFVSEISWETEVWIAGEPDHLIHFNGERFLGPYR